MSEETTGLGPNSTALFADLVCAYVSNNAVRAADLPELIATVHATLTGLANGTASIAAAKSKVEQATAGQIRKSIAPNALISFIDGKAYKTLKRHLTKHGHTPESYRRAYGLPEDYPMVSASYSEARSSLAKSIGLGSIGGHARRVLKAAA